MSGKVSLQGASDAQLSVARARWQEIYRRGDASERALALIELQALDGELARRRKARGGG